MLKHVTEDSISIDNLKCLFYGQSGAGKTFLSLTFPSPLMINLERGTGMLYPFTSFEADTYQEILTIFDLLDEDNGEYYSTIILDSVDELMYRIIQDTVLEYSVKRPYDDQLTQSDYGKLGRTTMDFCRRLITYAKHYHIVFLMSENPLNYEKEQRQPGATGNIVKKELPRLVDLYGCVYSDGGGNHKLNLYNSTFSLGKNRYNLPAVAIDNDFDSIVSFIKETN